MYRNLIGCLLDVGDGGGGGRGGSVGNILRFECFRIKSAPMQWGSVPFWPPVPDGFPGGVVSEPGRRCRSQREPDAACVDASPGDILQE